LRTRARGRSAASAPPAGPPVARPRAGHRPVRRPRPGHDAAPGPPTLPGPAPPWIARERRRAGAPRVAGTPRTWPLDWCWAAREPMLRRRRRDRRRAAGDAGTVRPIAWPPGAMPRAERGRVGGTPPAPPPRPATRRRAGNARGNAGGRQARRRGGRRSPDRDRRRRAGRARRRTAAGAAPPAPDRNPGTRRPPRTGVPAAHAPTAADPRPAAPP